MLRNRQAMTGCRTSSWLYYIAECPGIMAACDDFACDRYKLDARLLFLTKQESLMQNAAQMSKRSAC